MNEKHIGFLHPGAMGISLAVTAQNSGHSVHYASEGRSPATRGRAAEYDLIESHTIEELCDRCSVIISVCPPHVATEVAGKVLECSFNGLYVDVNAISPQRVQDIGTMMGNRGVEFVDGGIIGGPAWKPDTTVLYLSGHSAERVVECFVGGPLAVEVIGADIGRASALKMCFAANTKGTTALLCAVVAAAEEMGVRADLEKHWSRHGSEFAHDTLERIRTVTAKAWRFSGEMEEIASTFQAAGLPDGFHLAASEMYQRIAGFKGASPLPSVEDVLKSLLKPDGTKYV